MAFDLERAKQYLAASSLPSAPNVFGVTFDMEMLELDAARQQSLVVGSNVVSFTTRAARMPGRNHT